MAEDKLLQETRQISAKFYEEMYLIVGIVCVLDEAYLCLVTDCEVVATYIDDPVHRIKDVKFVPFKYRFLYASTNQAEGEKIL